MSEIPIEESEVVVVLELLPPRSRAAFAAACAERLQLGYADYAAASGKGNPAALREILAALWGDLATKGLEDIEIESLLEASMQLIPQVDDGTSLQAVAEDAAAAVAYALRCRRSGAKEEATWAARRCLETLDRYVIDIERIDISARDAVKRIRHHPVLQAELRRQKRDADELLRGAVSVLELRERSQEEAKGFLP
jgi:uncharacterized protein YjaG (DUF416 family)